MATNIVSRTRFLQSSAVRLYKIWLQYSKISSHVGCLARRDMLLARQRPMMNSKMFCLAFRARCSLARPNISFQVSKDALASFAEKINWPLSSNELLINALTHKSYVTSEGEDVLGTSFRHNERLIYLGYQTASSFIAEILYFKYPELSAEQLWDLHNGLLHENVLEECGQNLGLQDLIFSKDKMNGEIIAEALLAIIGSVYMDQPPGIAREFIENHLVPELAKERIKEICQLEHPKFMLKQLTTGVNLTAKILEKSSKLDVYGEETEHFKVGIFQQDEQISEGQGNSQLKAEMDACRNLLKERNLNDLKKAMFPYDYDEYTFEDEIDYGLLVQGIRMVEIEKGEEGFGFSVKGGEMRSEENREFVKYHFYFPPFVSSVVKDGPAERCGLKAGDIILAVNDKNTKGMSHHKVVQLLGSLKEVKLSVKFSKKVLIHDEIERKFGQFKRRKVKSQLKDPNWSKWYRSHLKVNRQEYETVFANQENMLPE